MTTQNDSGFKTFQATAVAIEAFVRVTVDSDGLISVAAATAVGIGVTQEAIAASGYGTVKLFSAPGTFQMQTAGAVTRGAALYAAASGEVDDSGTYRLPLVALEAATAQGDVIEVGPNDNMTTAVGTFLAADVGTIAAAGNSQGTATAITKMVTYVSAADGSKGVVLPACAIGAHYYVYNVANANLLIYPNTDDGINAGAANTKITVAAYTVYEFIGLTADQWACHGGTIAPA